MSSLAARLSATSETANRNSSTPAGPASYTHGLLGVDQSTNHLLLYLLWGSMAALCIFILVARFTQMGNAYLRHLFSLSASSEQQAFWAENRTKIWPNIKKHFVYAPIWKKRHNREIRLSTALNFGTLPSRFHLVLLSLYVLSNLAYCSLLDYGRDRSAVMADLRGRTGVLAVANMIPLVLLAGRNNPLIPMLKVSFDTYNLLHRWMGRIVILESFVHTLAWAINNVWAHGWPGINESLKASASFRYGMLGTLAMLVILIQSPSPIRHAFYETFLHLHQLLAFLTILGVYAHLKMAKLPQLPSIQAVVSLWVLDRVARWLRILYYNVSRNGCTTVTVEALPGEACRVKFDLVRHGTFTPGCHVYAYLPAVSLWMSHPFSVAWSEDHPAPPSPTTTTRTQTNHLSLTSATKESHLPITNTQTLLAALDAPPPSRTSISLVISARTGMTRALYTLADTSPQKTVFIKGFVEGPYGGLESLHSYGTLVLFAAGIGITHQVSHVRDLLAGYASNTIAARKIVLVWSVRNTEHLEWIRPFMDDVLQMQGRRDVLKVLIFVTKPRSPREVVSPSRSVQMFPGRANPAVLLDREIVERVGAMAVTVCGPGAFADTVREAVRRRVCVGSVTFVEEAFTW
ncbi:MAG: hypothetical protein M1812_007522 [Candelaria pacifica]|nr:MAG: hypothetical protein M1812_007522 [Candelaria pacifica]